MTEEQFWEQLAKLRGKFAYARAIRTCDDEYLCPVLAVYRSVKKTEHGRAFRTADNGAAYGFGRELGLENYFLANVIDAADSFQTNVLGIRQVVRQKILEVLGFQEVVA